MTIRNSMNVFAVLACFICYKQVRGTNLKYSTKVSQNCEANRVSWTDTACRSVSWTYFCFLHSYRVHQVVQKLLAVLLLVALEAWSPREKKLKQFKYFSQNDVRVSSGQRRESISIQENNMKAKETKNAANRQTSTLSCFGMRMKTQSSQSFWK